MATIKQEDFIQSITDALQFISYYHPADYIKALTEAWEKEESPAAKDAMAQILVNSRMCAEGHRPICQDTGMVVAFVDVGMDVKWEAELSLEEMVNEPVMTRKIPEKERRQYFDDHQELYARPEQIRLADIFIAVPPGSDQAVMNEKRAKAHDILALAQSTENERFGFSRLIKEYSDQHPRYRFGDAGEIYILR